MSQHKEQIAFAGSLEQLAERIGFSPTGSRTEPDGGVVLEFASKEEAQEFALAAKEILPEELSGIGKLRVTDDNGVLMSFSLEMDNAAKNALLQEIMQKADIFYAFEIIVHHFEEAHGDLDKHTQRDYIRLDDRRILGAFTYGTPGPRHDIAEHLKAHGLEIHVAEDNYTVGDDPGPHMLVSLDFKHQDVQEIWSNVMRAASDLPLAIPSASVDPQEMDEAEPIPLPPSKRR